MMNDGDCTMPISDAQCKRLGDFALDYLWNAERRPSPARSWGWPRLRHRGQGRGQLSRHPRNDYLVHVLKIGPYRDDAGLSVQPNCRERPGARR